MEVIDFSLMQSINAIAGRSILFDRFVSEIFTRPTFKMLPITASIVFVVCGLDRADSRVRALAQIVLAALVAMVVARIVQNWVAERPRPLHTPALGFVLPYGARADVLRDWSSFPSDHASVAFALAAGVWRHARSLGILCLAWAAVVISLPRLYLGYHYPTDIVGGAAIGLACAMLAFAAVEKVEARGVLRSRVPAPYVAAAAFVVLFQFTVLFDDVRIAARMAFHWLTGAPP